MQMQEQNEVCLSVGGITSSWGSKVRESGEADRFMCLVCARPCGELLACSVSCGFQILLCDLNAPLWASLVKRRLANSKVWLNGWYS